MAATCDTCNSPAHTPSVVFTVGRVNSPVDTLSTLHYTTSGVDTQVTVDTYASAVASQGLAGPSMVWQSELPLQAEIF